MYNSYRLLQSASFRCNEMNLAFISHGNIRTRYHCNYDGLHLNDKGATLFTENILSALNKAA